MWYKSLILESGTVRVINCQKAEKYEVADTEQLVRTSCRENSDAVAKHFE